LSKGSGYIHRPRFIDTVVLDVPIIEGEWTEIARIEDSITAGKYMLGASITFELGSAIGSELLVRWFINGYETETFHIGVDNDIDTEYWDYQFPLDLPSGDLTIYGEVGSSGGGVVDGLVVRNSLWVHKMR